MIEIDDDTTIGQAFERAAARHAHRPLLAVPMNPDRAYDPAGREITYGEAARIVRQLGAAYTYAGYGLGHRVGMLLENRLEHLLHKLALNTIGACCVPINPDYRPRETAALIDHARCDLLLVLHSRRDDVDAALRATNHRPPVMELEDFGDMPLPRATQLAQTGRPRAGTPASILYTSGTTGRPKGCVLSHRYELASGLAYATRGGLATIREGEDCVYNPLPLFHVNASILSFFGVLLSGCCQVQTDRFQPRRFWDEVRQSRATVVHYLGVIVQMLLVQPPGPRERDHAVRFGFGGGVEPQSHAAAEARFGFPLIELWGMTEMVRVLSDCHAPRQVGTRAFGRPLPEAGVEAQVVDEAGNEQPRGVPGELVIRHSASTPRRDFFSGYLDDPGATEAAWQGGWFHTGDIVTQDDSGMLHFVDRRKNIIRRSGENIAAAEVEAVLLSHPWVAQAAVMAVPDELREEEVLACVVLRREVAAPSGPGAADALFRHCAATMAYYKPPGWMYFAESIPTTGTQKMQKHLIFPAGSDPREAPGMLDLRGRKRRAP
ncbi:AMP-binding protein [Xylophilus sp. GOD-11R]|uniref:AMP-binding protein n=1 Tax=Xylophilus sp. GOD-11R TaxID=3089814 RepID=UPI00298CC32A|nr:AMP-binding protein [Xylophilus sp. GOD-11R]WPB57269.1 AMP-binding protein [Xylophilus sp. GOD-11R]